MADHAQPRARHQQRWRSNWLCSVGAARPPGRPHDLSGDTRRGGGRGGGAAPLPQELRHPHARHVPAFGGREEPPGRGLPSLGPGPVRGRGLQRAGPGSRSPDAAALRPGAAPPSPHPLSAACLGRGDRRARPRRARGRTARQRDTAVGSPDHADDVRGLRAGHAGVLRQPSRRGRRALPGRPQRPRRHGAAALRGRRPGRGRDPGQEGQLRQHAQRRPDPLGPRLAAGKGLRR